MHALTKLCVFTCTFLGTENQAELVEESIQHAKAAIALDVKDGNSWCKNSLSDQSNIISKIVNYWSLKKFIFLMKL